MKQLRILPAVALMFLGSIAAQAQSGGVPNSSECSIDLCIAPDVTIECVSEELDCQNFLIGESAGYCREFHATGGGKMNLTVAWGVSSSNPAVATVSGGVVSYGKTPAYETAQNVTVNPYSTQFSNGQSYKVRDHYLRICADVNAVGAGAASILYEATITDYSF